MYAIIEVGAKQYNVKIDDIIEVEKLQIQEGKEITLDKVLLVSKGEEVEVGTPYLKNASILALVLKQVKGKKAVSYKYRRRKASHQKIGHRQKLTRIQIKDIHL
jgi:large subunit ribosomal protein L21